MIRILLADDHPLTRSGLAGWIEKEEGMELAGLASDGESAWKALLELQPDLAMLDIDNDGLDEMDKRILETIIVKFGGGPVGISSLAVAVGEEKDTLEEVYEPYLIMNGYLNRTPQGRVVTPLSYKKIGLNPSSLNHQGRLF